MLLEFGTSIEYHCRMLSTAPDLVVSPSFMGNPILPTVVELLAAWTVHVSAHIRPKISKYVFPIET
jgi:hypothetical protein